MGGVTTGRFSPTHIRSIEVEPLDIPLLAPFGISRGAQAVAHNVLVTIELADGARGYGEGAPFQAYNGETQSAALAALREARAWLPGRAASDWRSLAEEFRKRGGAACGAAQCAMEMALLDALTRREGVPLWKFFGGAGAELETDMTVTTGSPQEATTAARAIAARGIRTIKVKIGGPAGPAHDLARIVAIHEVAPDAPLILDGNAALSRAEARELARGLKDRGIAPALLEQWLAKGDLDGLRALGEETGWLVAADESVCSARDAQLIAEKRAAHVVNIKLMKAGIAVALDIVRVAREAGLGLMIGGNLESILAMTTSACFAAGLGGFRFADLDTPLFLAENPFEGGYTLDGGRISVAHITAGHGVTPR
ncbi:MAG: dipeptide epimerase [Verrucomicrobia bacterium]|nr:dipeptide epimerase [Verrucomicrobiota bacterium]